jgi:hypothetical protein
MTRALVHYRTLEMAWAIAREQAGGFISTEEEVMWTESIADVWRDLSEEEQHLVEQLPVPGQDMSFVDRNVEIGDRSTERRAA